MILARYRDNFPISPLIVFLACTLLFACGVIRWVAGAADEASGAASMRRTSNSCGHLEAIR
ncbi:hypothetical protein CQW49_04310 [Methylosinus trichosporium OB3b]|uniref:Uncharacterized protein n=1 Tax=Methylosinus trichosporium (strain ATCC 35070 / NCIMB 11131 / UNIQEM 75 / OB3b) TaxID=595536 RepID=A0A2D2CWQ6_METT3|nr:hypothetical protein CQW49_04310 [Methylosinus trichosporium OB3b]OBS52218.1 hypothetical protein A8B73_12325 [Methylosinus sp. 3S-1]